MIRAFRICGTKWESSAFSGEGAKIAGGRWNTGGLPVVYCACSLSLATLEILVHLEDPGVLSRHFSFFEIGFPEEILTEIVTSALPANWRDEGMIPVTAALGDRWLRAMTGAVLSVPSAVTHGESIFLLNPRHEDFAKITIGAPQRFDPDPRLARS